MHDQISADGPMMRVQAPSMNVERKPVQALPVILLEGHPRAGHRGEVMKQLYGGLVHRQRRNAGPVVCASYRMSNSRNRSNSALIRLAVSWEKSWANR
jgi:hypothetical protein